MAFLDDLFEWAGQNYKPGNPEASSINVELSATADAPGFFPAESLNGAGSGSIGYFPSTFVREPFGGFGIAFPAYFYGTLPYGPQDGNESGLIPSSVDVHIQAPQITRLLPGSVPQSYEVVLTTSVDGSETVLAILDAPAQDEWNDNPAGPAGTLTGSGTLVLPEGPRPRMSLATITLAISTST